MHKHNVENHTAVTVPHEAKGKPITQAVRASPSHLVRWCFEPSQPQRILSGLKTNFNLAPSYSFRKSLCRKSVFLKPQLRLYPHFRNANTEKQHMFWGLFVFRGHSTREPAAVAFTNKQGDLFYFVSHSRHKKKNSGEVF